MTKLVTFSDQRGARVGAVLDNGNLLDLSEVYPQASDMLALIEAGPAALHERV